ncbi:MAG: hypothetical protein LBT25_05595 [Candidatus Symbiothrix sp.]|jgi:hypothetical protein|nr:hypothetical protein [Candidatus Symbiothrix sp.]
MSQFILFRLKEEKKNRAKFESILKVKNNSLFLQNCADVFFDKINKSKIFTISNFDDICVSTQELIVQGIDIKKTQLWGILYELREAEFFCWYGNELDSLDEFKNFDDLISNIKESLSNFSGEIYIHYKVC